METPEGFTKVSTGKYTKGDYTYTINATTGEVTATNGAEEPAESPIIGQYRSLPMSVGNGSAGTDIYFDFQEDGVFAIMMKEEQEDPYEQFYTGTYTYDEQTQTGRIFLPSEAVESQSETGTEFSTIATENNFIIICTELSGFSTMSKNGFTDFELPGSSLLGTYSDGTTQYVVSNKTDGDIQYGQIMESGQSNPHSVFWIINGSVMDYEGRSILFTTSGADTILTMEGDSYTKQ